jgi:hypothetical protein
VAFLFAVIPILSLIAWLPALVAIGLGIAGLVVKNRKRPLALVGLILGALSIFVGIAVTIGSVASLASRYTDDSPSVSQPSDEDATEEDEPAVPSKPTAAEWADGEYGTFATFTQSGTGDSVVALPAGAEAGIVASTHDGSSNFSVSAIDANNEPTGDLLVNEIGAYNGGAEFGVGGLSSVGDPAASLKISADGNWTVTISPISAAPQFPSSGTGDGVFLYDGDASNLALTHDGDSNFSVVEYTSELFGTDLLVNEIGSYTGTVPLSAGPALVTVSANGNWTATLG